MGRSIATFVRGALALLSVSVVMLAGFAIPVQAGSDPNCTDPQAACSTSNTATTPTIGVYGVEARAVAAQMAAHPTPGLTPYPANPADLYSRAYRQVIGATDVYDAPNGNVISHIDAGFNFVNAGDVQNGWAQIRPGQWLPEKVLGPINKAVSKFSGVQLP